MSDISVIERRNGSASSGHDSSPVASGRFVYVGDLESCEAPSNMETEDSSDDFCTLSDNLPQHAEGNDTRFLAAGFSENSTSHDSDESDEHVDLDLADRLKHWVFGYNIPSNATTSLLDILHPYHPTLPRDSRTLLGTPARTVSCDLRDVEGGGHYYHFGIEHCLNKTFVNGGIDEQCATAGSLEIQVNVDGLPLYKSSGYQLWPILGRIICPTLSSEPFVIGLYAGHKKPQQLSDYLKDFVNEFQGLESSGVLLDGHHYHVRLHSVVCDTPARNFLKCTKGHTGYYGCDRCCQPGKWLGKMTFPEVSASKRTDVSFSEMSDEDHHLKKSPLTCLHIGLVSQFPLDYMHLVCLGVMRRLLVTWMGIPGGPKLCKLSSRYVAQISEKLLNLRPYMPCEFVRKPRGLSELDRWKAVEFRQILLYTGCVVFPGILNDAVYKNFLLLHVAMRLVLTPVHSSQSVDFA